MSYKMTDHTIIDLAKVGGANLLAIGITLSNTKEWLSLISILIAIGYTLWKWFNDIKKIKKNND